MVTPVILNTKLKLGGKWYLRGSRVELEDKDAQSYMALRMARAGVPVAPPQQPQEQPIRRDAPDTETTPAPAVETPPQTAPKVVIGEPEPKKDDVVEKLAPQRPQQFHQKHGKGRR